MKKLLNRLTNTFRIKSKSINREEDNISVSSLCANASGELSQYCSNEYHK